MTYATADDVVTLWAREPEPEVRAMISRRLRQIERMIVRRIPDLDQKVIDGDIDVAELRDVEAEAVLRHVRNPDGHRSEQDGAYGYELSASTADNRLRLTEEEWGRLGIRPTGKMFVINPRLS